MHRPVMKLVLVVIGAATVVHAQTPAASPPQAAPPAAPPAANQTNLGSDANGNPLRRALRTGHQVLPAEWQAFLAFTGRYFQ